MLRHIFTHRTKELFAKSPNSALILLNWEFPRRPLELIWGCVKDHVCADGAANRLLLSNAQSQHQLYPDYVHGDLDSIHNKTRLLFEEQGVRVIQNKNQDCTDLDKCLSLVQNLHSRSLEPDPMSTVVDFNPNTNNTKGMDSRGNSSNSSSSSSSSSNSSNNNNNINNSNNPFSTNIFVLGAFGGRLDHELANLSSALRWSNNNTASSSSLTLLSEHSLAYVLCPGTHHIYPDFALEGSTCGLIPLGMPCESITTTGLKWDLNDARLELGGFISSSNTIENGIEKITVTTSHSILWTTQIDWVNYEYESRLAAATAAGSSKL